MGYPSRLVVGKTWFYFFSMGERAERISRSFTLLPLGVIPISQKVYASKKVAVKTVYFSRVFRSTFQKCTRIYSILLGVH